MFRIMGFAGPWAVPLAVLTIWLAALIVRAALKARGSRAEEPDIGRLRSAILFWGFVSAILGFLGQCVALYRITTVVVSASALSPEILAEGFAGSFVPTLWGGGLLLVAGLAWLGLRRRGSRGAHVAALLLTVLVTASACAPSSERGPADITRGVWVGHGGPDRFLFDLRGTPPDSLRGVVHVMRGDKMTSEVAITRASYHAPDLEMFMASTNATYKGRVELAGGRIRGGLTFGGNPGSKMDLRWVDPTGLPGFRARPEGDVYAYRTPATGDDGWAVASPEEVGLDRGALESLVNAVARGDAGLIHSLVLVRHGKLVLDEYFHGYRAADLHRLASVTKSVSALLVGAALDRGAISNLDVPLLHFFPDAARTAGPAWERETLRDLLTMSMGLDWTPEEAESVHGTGTAFFRRVFARKVDDPPGTRWEYVNANVNLLAGVIFNATGKQADAFARDVLFDPLGIRAYDWSYGKEGGYPLMDGSLRMRPRDLAKIGTLVAQGGRWSGHQVIGRRWIDELTGRHFDTGLALDGYGDLWWLGHLPGARGPEPIIVANGWGSQFVVVFPRLDMVVVTTGGNDDNGRHLDIGGVLAEHLLASM